MIQIGVKTDPIHTRYSFAWLFDLLEEENIKYIQLGSFPELYALEDDYFYLLKEQANARGLKFKSMFTAYRELGGFFSGDIFMEKVARKHYERFIQIAALLEVDYCGSNPGSVYRDAMHIKAQGTACYLSHMQELMHLAFEQGLKALTMEPMSCMAEPPTLPQEIDYMLGTLSAYHEKNKDTVPVYLCGDISHGYVDAEHKVIYSSKALFEYGIKSMAEFHFKNTDHRYNDTFGFSAEEQAKGIIKLETFRNIIEQRQKEFPVEEVVGYLEIKGPKTGRDYSDGLLSQSLRTSLRAIKEVFAQPVQAL